MWEDSGVEAYIWIPIQHGYATLREVETEWTYVDCLRALAAIRAEGKSEALKREQ